jgi:hypothetical protein
MPQDAIMCYQRALQARPDYAMAYGEIWFFFFLCQTLASLYQGIIFFKTS